MTTILKTFTNSVKHWYLPLILGIIFIIFGIYVISTPVETYLTLSILFSISFIVSGLLDIFFSVQNSKALSGWGWYLVSGLLSLAIGIYLLAYPAISVSILPFVVGFALLFRSFQLLGFSFDLKDAQITNWGTLAIVSVLGIILSILLISDPVFSGISIVSLTAASFIFTGVASVILAFNLKKVKNYPEKMSKELKEKIQNLDKELSQVKA